LVEKSRNHLEKVLQRPSFWRAKNIASDQTDSKKAGSQAGDSSSTPKDSLKPFDLMQRVTSYCSKWLQANFVRQDIWSGQGRKMAQKQICEPFLYIITR
jgi:hypothetical protein